MSSPERKFVMKIELQADDWDALIRELYTIARCVEQRPDGETVASSVMGGVNRHHNYSIRCNPEQTHENYFAEIDQWLRDKKQEAS